MTRYDADVVGTAAMRQGLQVTIVESQYRPGRWLVILDGPDILREWFADRAFAEVCLRRYAEQRVCAVAPVEPLIG